MSKSNLKTRIQQSVEVSWSEKGDPVSPQLRILSEKILVKEVDALAEVLACVSHLRRKQENPHAINKSGKKFPCEESSRPPMDRLLRMESLIKILFDSSGDRQPTKKPSPMAQQNTKNHHQNPEILNGDRGTLKSHLRGMHVGFWTQQYSTDSYDWDKVY